MTASLLAAAIVSGIASLAAGAFALYVIKRIDDDADVDRDSVRTRRADRGESDAS